MDLFSPARPTNQSFHQISNPETIFNQNFDGFPNDREFRFGHVVYDESGLTDGTGLAPITELTFNLAADPANPAHLNWRRCNVNTIFDVEQELEGTVELVEHQPVGATLSADFEFEAIGVLNATITGYYPAPWSSTATSSRLPPRACRSSTRSLARGRST